jgi:putative 4-mercaptohistidine N1-methyltranferase
MYPAISPQGSTQNSLDVPLNPYESDSALQEYLLFQYGVQEEMLPYENGPHNALDYAVRCVSECVDFARLKKNARALDLGCAVGRSCYELARGCAEVVGIDFSSRFIAAAEKIRRNGSLLYKSLEEGDRTAERVARRPEGIECSRIHFEQGDAMRLRKDLGVFDVVLMANLVDRLSDPKRCLSAIADSMSQGGQLVITSPYTWMEQFTPKQNWLCSSAPDNSRSSLDGIARALGARFRLERTLNLPFLIREHARKYQWSVAQASCWTYIG